MVTTDGKFPFNKNAPWPSYFILLAIAPSAFVVKSLYFIVGISALLFLLDLVSK